MIDTDDPTRSADGSPAQAAAAPQQPDSAISELPADALIVLPVRELVLFPGFVAPIAIGRPTSLLAAQEAVRHELQIAVVMQRDPADDDPDAHKLHRVGTAARIVRYVTAPDGTHHVVCQGVQRVRIKDYLTGHPYLVAQVERLGEQSSDDAEIEARLAHLKTRASELLELLPGASAELASTIAGIDEGAPLTDFLAAVLDLKSDDKQALLEAIELRDRMDRLLVILGERLEVMRLSHKIDQQTRGRIDEKQREFLLREQLRTIQQELGETGEDAAGIEELADAIDKAAMSEEADRLARKELKRLARMGEGAAEYAMLRTYIEWLTELPWSVFTEDRIDIAEARRILDQDHCGLGKVKRRILEHLAVHKLNPHARSPILCFVGPPGVGKTSLGQSIARATARKFARVSLGGVHDEAEIRGHRRTYVGALPGNIVQALRKAGARNCVMMLDELDKLGAGIQGDPAAALLEVLDPEQNASFRDNYLGVPFDLSAVMFVGTANVLDTIPGPLRDRMEVIALPGYTEDEKAQIARRFLLTRQLEANGLAASQCEIADEAIHAIIADYTREAGVRNLERELGNVLRHSAVRIAEGAAIPVRVAACDLAAILGPARFENEVALRTSQAGVATGLAWTPAGGDILFIEASLVPGRGRLIQTGQLGDVMKESVQAALTLVKAQASRLGLAPDLFETHDIHVHVPAGAIPKDGPSAGVAMFIALASLVTGRPVRADRAMTGEISLRGLVLPVGGIKEKVLAALRAGIATVMLPARNRKDLDEIPTDARQRLHFEWLETVDDALREALEGPSPA